MADEEDHTPPKVREFASERRLRKGRKSFSSSSRSRERDIVGTYVDVVLLARENDPRILATTDVVVFYFVCVFLMEHSSFSQIVDVTDRYSLLLLLLSLQLAHIRLVARRL